MSVAEFGDTRTISFYHIHTKETLTITYKRDGKFDKAALKKINWLMRDWREDEEIAIDPKTIDLLWEMHTELRSKEPIHIICGYRSQKTNNMLRRTRGGQATRSYHIRGQAIDAAFPDVPVKQMRYSALVRQMGGVGYYPNSGIPFVHVDSGPVRAWPRLPRKELALLFPSGSTKHRPSSGGSLKRSDVESARKDKKIAGPVAEYFKLRNTPHSPAELAVAALGPLKAPPPQPAARPPVRVAAAPPPAKPEPKLQVAALEPVSQAPAPSPAPTSAQPPPAARPVVQSAAAMPLASPQPVAASPTAVAPSPTPARFERARLNELVSLASLTTTDQPQPRVRPPEDDRRRLNALFSTAAIDGAGPTLQPQPAVLPLRERADRAPANRHEPRARVSEAGWAPQPEFDDDHPEEISYRPFPIAPLLTQSPSADDAALTTLVHPDVDRTLDLMDGGDVVMPLRLRPGPQVMQAMSAQQFRGEAVDLAAIEEVRRARNAPIGLASRHVRTTAR